MVTRLLLCWHVRQILITFCRSLFGGNSFGKIIFHQKTDCPIRTFLSRQKILYRFLDQNKSNKSQRAKDGVHLLCTNYGFQWNLFFLGGRGAIDFWRGRHHPLITRFHPTRSPHNPRTLRVCIMYICAAYSNLFEKEKVHSNQNSPPSANRMILEQPLTLMRNMICLLKLK